MLANKSELVREDPPKAPLPVFTSYLFTILWIRNKESAEKIYWWGYS